MTSHSVWLSTIVDREAESHHTSPSSSRTSPVPSTMLQTSNPYWGTDQTPSRDYPYSQYRTEIPPPLDTSLAPPSRSSSHHYRHQSDSSNPTIDFSGLIPMYEPGSPDSRNQLLDLPYNTEWPTSNMAQYATFQRNKSSLWLPSSPKGHSSSQQWDSSLSVSLVQHFNEYVPDSSPSSTTSSSPPPSYFASPPSTSNHLPRSPNSQRGNKNPDAQKKSCFHCHVTTTPLWRRDPSTQRTLCNACGLYLQQRNKLRPQELIEADIDDDDEPQIPDEEYTGPKCSHCLTRNTSVWRRSKTGAQVCNACGVYARLRGKERPLSLRRNKIKPRTKHSR